MKKIISQTTVYKCVLQHTANDLETNQPYKEETRAFSGIHPLGAGLPIIH